jgi:peptide deformylase
MAVLPIIEVPDPRLKLVSEPVEGVTDEVRQLVADMFDTMYDAPGIGLAAIQVAVPK